MLQFKNPEHNSSVTSLIHFSIPVSPPLLVSGNKRRRLRRRAPDVIPLVDNAPQKPCCWFVTDTNRRAPSEDLAFVPGLGLPMRILTSFVTSVVASRARRQRASSHLLPADTSLRRHHPPGLDFESFPPLSSLRRANSHPMAPSRQSASRPYTPSSQCLPRDPPRQHHLADLNLNL